MLAQSAPASRLRIDDYALESVALVANTRHGVYKDKEKRRLYMRNLMRAKRARP